jgi:hypothetical protein
MTPAEKKALQDFFDAVLGHEAGHVTVPESVLMDSTGPFTGTVKSDALPTGESARANLQEKLEDLKSQAETQLDQATAEYDTVTDHGRTQRAGPPKFPGGPNIELIDHCVSNVLF